MTQAAETYLAAQRPSNTRRTYATAWRLWENYAAEIGITALDGSLGALVGFVRWLELHNYAPSTVDSRLTGAIMGLRGHGVPVARQASARAREELRNYRRRLTQSQTPTGRGQAWRGWRRSDGRAGVAPGRPVGPSPPEPGAVGQRHPRDHHRRRQPRSTPVSYQCALVAARVRHHRTARRRVRHRNRRPRPLGTAQQNSDRIPAP